MVPELSWVLLRTVTLSHAVRLPSATISARTPSIARQLRRRAGMPRKTSNARTVPLPVPAHLLPLPSLGQFNPLLLTAVVVTVAVGVGVPIIDPEAKVTVEPFKKEQLGRSVAPMGDEVSAQARVTVPT